MKLYAIEVCDARWEETMGGFEYVVPDDCKISAITTVSRLEQALRMIISDDERIKQIIELFEKREELKHCTDFDCIVIHPIFLVL